jgi:hypothetical protein
VVLLPDGGETEMALQLGALRDALIEAGATPDKANKAAEELAGYEREFAEIKGDLRVLKWAQAANFAAVVAVLLKLFLH